MVLNKRRLRKKVVMKWERMVKCIKEEEGDHVGEVDLMSDLIEEGFQKRINEGRILPIDSTIPVPKKKMISK